MKSSILILLTMLIGFAVYSIQTRPEFARAESTEAFKKEQELIRINMVQLSRELGVTCVDCHSSKNWKDESKATYRTAKDHMKTVEVLRASGFNGKKNPEASCFMCHQGKAKFVNRMQHPENRDGKEPKTE